MSTARLLAPASWEPDTTSQSVVGDLQREEKRGLQNLACRISAVKQIAMTT